MITKRLARRLDQGLGFGYVFIGLWLWSQASKVFNSDSTCFFELALCKAGFVKLKFAKMDSIFPNPVYVYYLINGLATFVHER